MIVQNNNADVTVNNFVGIESPENVKSSAYLV